MMTGRMTYYSKIALWVVGIVSALMILPFCYLNWAYPLLWEGMARREAKACLASSRDPAVLEKTIGSRGWVIPLKNGEWIAARYDDNHAGAVQSLFLAVDSQGHWYQSRHHFCGELAAYTQRLHWLKIQGEILQGVEEMLQLCKVAHAAEFDAAFHATSLDDAWQHLRTFGFLPVSE